MRRLRQQRHYGQRKKLRLKHSKESINPKQFRKLCSTVGHNLILKSRQSLLPTPQTLNFQKFLELFSKRTPTPSLFLFVSLNFGPAMPISPSERGSYDVRKQTNCTKTRDHTTSGLSRFFT